MCHLLTQGPRKVIVSLAFSTHVFSCLSPLTSLCTSASLASTPHHLFCSFLFIVPSPTDCEFVIFFLSSSHSLIHSFIRSMLRVAPRANLLLSVLFHTAFFCLPNFTHQISHTFINSQRTSSSSNFQLLLLLQLSSHPGLSLSKFHSDTLHRHPVAR